MASQISLSNGDLRSAAVEYNRYHTQKAKWALGENVTLPGGRVLLSEGLRRPIQPSSKPSFIRQSKAYNTGKLNKHKVSNTLYENEVNSTDSSADEDVTEASAAPAPDAEITYSYDARGGPGKGSQILGMALAKAVEKFEVKETERLVDEEYEVLGEDGEPVARGKAKKGKGKAEIEEGDDEDFELV
ncbi:MAG: hypothetical protein M1827_005976 [Pycnora praestabilis]|nr:MAG: hypothetical protein M1827_005976 [Pycnora praestabilis]